MRVNLQPAYVLHSRPYRDTSAIIELFTPEYGRLSAVARGVRRQSRRRSSSARTQPFSPLLVSFSGRAELKTLVASESAGQPHVLAGNGLFSGLYLNELLVRLLHRHDPHPELFAFYAATLERLASGEALEPVLREFELQLLDDLGYSVDFTVDAHSGLEVRKDCLYVYQTELGLVHSPRRPDNGKPAYSGADLKQIAGGDYSGAGATTAKRLLREVLAGHLGGEPLRSRQLFRSARSGEGLT